jgi:hypothetical protein
MCKQTSWPKAQTPLPWSGACRVPLVTGLPAECLAGGSIHRACRRIPDRYLPLLGPLLGRMLLPGFCCFLAAWNFIRQLDHHWHDLCSNPDAVLNRACFQIFASRLKAIFLDSGSNKVFFIPKTVDASLYLWQLGQ